MPAKTQEDIVKEVATAMLAATMTAPTAPTTPKPVYVNNTSRLRKYVCDCTEHFVDARTGRTRPGPYVFRMAGTGALIRCEFCDGIFELEDTKPTRRLYRGCKHCTNPEEHRHADIEDIETEPAAGEDIVNGPYHPHASVAPCGDDCIP